MADQSFDATAYIEAVAPALSLPIPAECRPGVIANLERIAELAQFVMAFPLADEDEAGPVFTP